MSKMSKKTVLSVALFFISLIVIVPILVYSNSSVPGADDFSAAIAMRGQMARNNSYFFSALKNTKEYYFEERGCFLSVFFFYFFSAMFHGKDWISWLRFFNTLSNTLFFASSLCFISIVTKNILKQSYRFALILFDIFVIALYNGNTLNHEIYTWYTVQSVYILPMSLTLFIWSLYILSLYKQSRVLLLLTVGGNLILGGVSLNIVILNIEMVLLLSLYLIVVFGYDRRILTVFVSLFPGTILNVIAPGNYTKYKSISDDKYSLYVALKKACAFSQNVILNRVSKASIIPAMLVVLFVLYMCVDYKKGGLSKLNYRYPLIVAFMSYLGVVFVGFPVIYAYSQENLEPHCLYIHDIALLIFGFVVIVYITGWINNKHIDDIIKRIWNKSQVTKCILILLVCVYIYGIRSSSTLYMIDSIQSGRLKANALYYEDVLREIENSKEIDCVLKRPEIVKDELYYPIGLTDDKDYWINESIAEYYGKKSVALFMAPV